MPPVPAQEALPAPVLTPLTPLPAVYEDLRKFAAAITEMFGSWDPQMSIHTVYVPNTGQPVVGLYHSIDDLWGCYRQAVVEGGWLYAFYGHRWRFTTSEPVELVTHAGRYRVAPAEQVEVNEDGRLGDVNSLEQLANRLNQTPAAEPVAAEIVDDGDGEADPEIE